LNNNFSPGKRARELEQARKRQEKESRRAQRRERGPMESEFVSAAEVQGNLPSIEEAMRQIENPGAVPRAASGIAVRLFVGSLGDEVNEADLRAAFGQFGPVVDAIVMVDRDTRAPRGFGFVTMGDRRDAQKAIEALHGAEIKGRNIVVNVATERGR
jgi:hypothetical protein